MIFMKGVLMLQNTADMKKSSPFLTVLDFLADASLLLLLCVLGSHNSMVEGTNYAYYVAFFLYLGLMFLRSLFTGNLYVKKFTVPVHTIWYGLFILLTVLSVLWSRFPSVSGYYTSRLVQNLVLIFFMLININSEKELDKIQNIFILSNIYMSVRILFLVPVSRWFSRFVGGYDLTGHNVNMTAFYLSVAVLICFYKIYVEKRYRYIIPIALFIFMLTLTSSRKSLIMSAMGIGLIIFLDRSKKKKILSIFILIAALIAFVYIIFNDEKLYKAIGWKFDSMLGFLENNTGDNSLRERKLFREYALKLFYEHPFIGVGFNNFSRYLKLIFTRATYSHNNWLEMLSNLGIIGFAAYYWFYVYVIVKLVKKWRSRERKSVYYLSYMICLIITEYSMVVFYDTMIQITIALCFAASFLPLSNKDEKKLTETEKF